LQSLRLGLGGCVEIIGNGVRHGTRKTETVGLKAGQDKSKRKKDGQDGKAD
jgi:hypothetical protein